MGTGSPTKNQFDLLSKIKIDLDKPLQHRISLLNDILQTKYVPSIHKEFVNLLLILPDMHGYILQWMKTEQQLVGARTLKELEEKYPDKPDKPSLTQGEMNFIYNQIILTYDVCQKIIDEYLLSEVAIEMKLTINNLYDLYLNHGRVEIQFKS